MLRQHTDVADERNTRTDDRAHLRDLPSAFGLHVIAPAATSFCVGQGLFRRVVGMERQIAPTTNWLSAGGGAGDVSISAIVTSVVFG